MIQRKQTIYLLLALAALIACLCLPIGRIEPRAMGVDSVWYNMGLFRDGAFTARPMLFVDLVVVGVLAFVDIFLYRKRKIQAQLCTVNILLTLAWYVYYAITVFSVFQTNGTFHFGFAACLPFVAIILFVMARRGIIADEKLVKSADRIR